MLSEIFFEGTFVQWKEGAESDVEFYTRYPMSMKEIREKLEYELEMKRDYS